MNNIGLGISTCGLSVALAGALSSCSSAGGVPESLAQSCYVISLGSSGSVIKSDIYANIGDILEPIIQMPNAKVSFEGTDEAPIFRASFVDEFSKNEKSVALQFQRSSPTTEFIAGDPLKSHCGPAVFGIVRGSLDGVELSTIELARFVGTSVSRSPWPAEAVVKMRERDAVPRPSRPTQDSGLPVLPVKAQPSSANGSRSDAASDFGDCKGQWIYTPKAWANDVGVALKINTSGSFRLDFSDYGNSLGKWSVNGRMGEDKIILGDAGEIHYCGGDTAELSLIDGPERTINVHRFKGDAYKEWIRHGLSPDGE